MPKISINWCLVYDSNLGVIDPDKILEISKDFDIDISVIEGLSLSLATALSRGTFPRGFREPLESRRKGHLELNSVITELGSAAMKTQRAATRLTRLQSNADHPSLEEIEARIERAASELLASQQILQGHIQMGAWISLRGSPDKRRARDFRRSMVCSRIFDVWSDVGRSLTYSTDPLTSERGGWLIEFVNAVVGCISQPPGRLGGETIIREIKRYNDFMPAFKASMDAMRAAGDLVSRSQKTKNLDT